MQKIIGYLCALLCIFTKTLCINCTVFESGSFHQLKTCDVVKMSAANIKPDDITHWYMRVFGVEKNASGGYCENGFDECGRAKRIINVSEKCNLFVENFRKIASTPVGRVLLYRILIEIYKPSTGNMNRDKLRNIRLEINDNFGFSEEMGTLYVSKKNTFPSVLGKSSKKGYTYITYSKSASTDINLFHELCHWYHYLSDYERVYKGKRTIGLFDNKLGEFYWGEIMSNDVRKRESSCIPWENDRYVNFEEIRTILGSCQDIEGSQEGDDLCENLYRACIGAPLRFGHKSSSITFGAFFEDNRVIEKVKKSIMKAAVNYSIDLHMFNTKAVREKEFAQCYCIGLGMFRCGNVCFPRNKH